MNYCIVITKSITLNYTILSISNTIKPKPTNIIIFLTELC